MLDIDAISPSPMSAPISGKTEQVPFNIAPPPQERLRKMFDDARTQSNTTRLQAQKWRDYYDGPEQLNSDVRRVLDMRKQPAIYTNRVRPMIDGVLGMLESSKVDPQCRPRNPTPEDENAADIATKTLRYIADVSNLEKTLLDTAENFFIEGTEAAIVEADGEEIPITQIRYEEFFADPFSRRPDFLDAKYMGIAQWKDASDVRAAWPDQYKAMGDPLSGGAGPRGALDSTWQDRPDNIIPWVDRVRQRMMVVEVYYTENRGEGPQWYHCIYCAAGVFVHELSQYRDKRGNTVNPIQAESCYVDRKNNRYGRILDAIPIQDEINARRSRSLHLTNSRQLQEITPGASNVDATTARMEAARADGIIPTGLQIVPTTDLSSGNLLLLQEAKNELERMSPTPAAKDLRDGTAVSGRARLVAQQAGMTEIARPLGRHNDFRERIYRACWERAQQFWTAPMFIRVTDETKAPDFLQINEPVMGMVMQQMQAPDGLVIQVPSVGQVGQKNRIAEMDMDIIVTTAPDTVDLQQEVFADLMGIVEKIGLQAVFSPEFGLILEMSTLQNKAEILEKIKEAQGGEDPKLQQAQQIIQQLTQQVQELTEGVEAAKRDKTIADTGLSEAKTALTEAQTLIASFEAGQASVPEPVDEPEEKV